MYYNRCNPVIQSKHVTQSTTTLCVQCVDKTNTHTEIDNDVTLHVQRGRNEPL